jgi:UDP-N-acetyl-D-galactosamine dehydrogenase
MDDFGSIRIAVIGLGYVGLPLAVEFAKYFTVVGFDHNPKRIDSLRASYDATLELSEDELKNARHLHYSTDIADLKNCSVYIVTVPTPIDEKKNPDIRLLLEASKTIGQVLAKGDIVIYESTVYPGATEDECVPVIEANSGLKLNEDFYVGYSPERINPGDKLHRISDIKKVTSGSTPEAALYVDALYKKIIKAGTHLAPSIKVAEAAKVIENTQRDLNIALINELAIIFNKMQIDTQSVLDAAATKWNFLPFKPGLVGGHCIGVDPYYLTHKAQAIGYRPEIILAGRSLNDGMSLYVASQAISNMKKHGIEIEGSRVLVMGMTFKENCPDIRNSRIPEIVNFLKENECLVDVYDPWVDPIEAVKEYGISLIENLDANSYDAIIVAVAHDCLRDMKLIKTAAKENCVIYDLKSVFKKEQVTIRL